MQAACRTAARASLRVGGAHVRGVSSFGKSLAFDAIFGGSAAVDAVMLQNAFVRAEVPMAAPGTEALTTAMANGGTEFTAEDFDKFISQNPSTADAWALRHVVARLGAPAIAGLRRRAEGARPSEEFRLFYESAEGETISPWHDIPLQNEDSSLNMVVEIPKFTRAKMEIATKEEFNPIKQDMKKGKLRNYGWGDMFVNYGALPQTWEDPAQKDEHTGAAGDDDPVDIIEVGTVAHPFGSVIKVKALGVLGMIDEGEMDWKVVGISTADPMADVVHSLEDLERVQPSVLHAFREWMRVYKTVDGKPENEFAFNGEWQDERFALDVIADTHESWKQSRN